jgi:hypothetical protein
MRGTSYGRVFLVTSCIDFDPVIRLHCFMDAGSVFTLDNEAWVLIGSDGANGVVAPVRNPGEIRMAGDVPLTETFVIRILEASVLGPRNEFN